MVNSYLDSLTDLYLRDETAWLERMSRMAADGRADELDLVNLSEYLSDMARLDRREVYSRLVILLSHLLKWQHQPSGHCASWRATIREQRRELRLLFESATLQAYAQTVFDQAHSDARAQAADETGLALATFPPLSPWSLEIAVVDAPLN